jgi:hypothetical protein
MAPEWTHSLTEMSARYLAGGKGRPERKTGSLAAVSLLSRIYRILDVSQPYERLRPVRSIGLL